MRPLGFLVLIGAIFIVYDTLKGHSFLLVKEISKWFQRCSDYPYKATTTEIQKPSSNVANTDKPRHIFLLAVARAFVPEIMKI